MGSTVRYNCAAWGIEERIDQYDEMIGKDPEVREAWARIKDALVRLRESMARFTVSPDEQERMNQMFIELEDLITELESKDVLAIAKADMDGVGIIIKLGLMYEGHWPEERR